MTAYVFEGARAPEAVQITVTPSAAVPDLSTVVSAYAEVRDRFGNVTQWAFAIVSQLATQLVLRHVFASDGSEVPDPKELRLLVYLTFPASVVRRCEPTNLDVLRV